LLSLVCFAAAVLFPFHGRVSVRTCSFRDKTVFLPFLNVPATSGRAPGPQTNAGPSRKNVKVYEKDIKVSCLIVLLLFLTQLGAVPDILPSGSDRLVGRSGVLVEYFEILL
jgi:hypothetical protein